ncbi:MAG: DUF86 domain-containing protein [Xanthobacteraceae bacterium]|nr:DUF86 domain-containing protein [Xanthobacteraceae bacterium]
MSLPSDKPLIRLNDILENVERILRYTEGYDFERFVSDARCQDAVERCLLRISEAARKLSAVLDEIAPGQPWSDVRAVGNVLRHEYDAVDPAVIWQIVEKDLVPLHQAVEKAIRDLGEGSAKPE